MEKKNGWSRETIKYIAVAAMLLNHTAHLFMPADSMLRSVMIGVGYFTAITMCYFLTEGFWLTKSRKTYAKRLFVFACVAQIPYYLAFGAEGKGTPAAFNMLFSLLLCLALLVVLEQRETDPLYQWKLTGIMIAGLFCDWPVMAQFFTWQFYQNKQDGLSVSYKKAVLLFCCMNVIGSLGTMAVAQILVETVAGALAMGASCLCISKKYSGSKTEKSPGFHKWFFYVFYPAHLVILLLLRFYIDGMVSV